MFSNVLSIEKLTVTVAGDMQEKALVKDVSFEIPELCISALVGGSGSGKTTTGLSILRLLPSGLNIRSGRIVFKGEELLSASGERMREVRGKEVSMVFQDPLDAFNPVFTIGDQMEEVLRFHTSFNRGQRRERVLEFLDLAGLPDPKRVVHAYPHQLSGGMRQRAMIAQAIAAHPKLIIADEPTSSLDVTLQARIMDLFRKLKEELKLSILLITHDLGMVAHMADEVAVMREGKIVEQGKTQEVLRNPRHPYTQQLMDALKV